MKLIAVLLLLTWCSCLGVRGQRTLDSYFPRGFKCVTYNRVLEDRSWVCQDSQYQAYPETDVQSAMDSGLYPAETRYLNITVGCTNYTDAYDAHGVNKYYEYDSLCQAKRIPVRVLWAAVPGYVLKPEEAVLNKGLLPVHVVKGQDLNDIYCMHPWAGEGSSLAHLPPRQRKVVQNRKWTNLEKHLCQIGYLFNNNYMCTPSGHINRKVVVFSKHANKLFKVTVPNVPTSCSCIKCECTKGMPTIVG